MRKESLPIVIAGAGPAGSTLAIRLRQLDLPVVLIERFRFPREKLCGEFISPECLEHFRELDCLDSILEAGGDRISETRFYEVGGRSIIVPSKWFTGSGFAVSLSRARMDQILLEKARACGTDIREETSVTGLVLNGNKAAGVKVRSADGSSTEINADLVVDATGRGRVLAGSIEKERLSSPRAKFVGFKAHFNSINMPRGVCEIYAFKGGYAGLSHIENGLANLCFLSKASLLRSFSGPDAIVEHLRSINIRAAETLNSASRIEDWHAVSVPRFGSNDPLKTAGLLTVGDSAAFADPFTGSGMLMAMESARLLADVISRHGLDHLCLNKQYQDSLRKHFSSRLKTSGIIRSVAYEPLLSTPVVRLLSLSERLRILLARQTRSARSGRTL